MRLVISILLLLVATARADELAEARQLYDDGLRHYNVAEYDRAIAAWKQAYVLSKRPLLLFNIGQAYRLAGDCASALKFYDNYRREEPKPKPELEGAIADCANRPPPTPDAPPPPQQQPDAAPPPIEFGPIPKLVGTPPDRRKQIAGLIVGGLGVAAGGAAIYFAVDSNKQSENLDNFTGSWTSKEDAIERRGKRDVVLAYGFGAGGAVAVIAGGVLLWLGRDHRELEVEIAPVRGGGAAATWTSRF